MTWCSKLPPDGKGWMYIVLQTKMSLPELKHTITILRLHTHPHNKRKGFGKGHVIMAHES